MRASGLAAACNEKRAGGADRDDGASAADAYCSLVWQAFAALGIGDGAKGTVVSSTSAAITESTKTRSDCTYQ